MQDRNAYVNKILNLPNNAHRHECRDDQTTKDILGNHRPIYAKICEIVFASYWDNNFNSCFPR